ncbi:MAG: chemotaxis protein CheB [Betaproteobacteria bacterium]
MLGSPITSVAQRPRFVALGASAGGLEPLEQFLAQLPIASGLAYLVVQHVDPTIAAVLKLLHAHNKRDLTQYKSRTLLRRIERRMAVHVLATMTAYVGFESHLCNE